MMKKTSTVLKLIALTFVIVLAVLFLSAAQRHTLILDGRSTDVPVIYMNGHPYVELEALANALNGSISSSGATVALSLPSGSTRASSMQTAPPVTSSAASSRPVISNPGFSQEFLKAGIEQMSTLREWHAALQTAIESGIPLSEGLLQPYRAQATTNLRLASAAATTPADKSAYQLLNNVYQNMGKLSDKYVNMRASMTYIAPNALQDDELNKRILNCGRFLGAMAASGEFNDDGSCH